MFVLRIAFQGELGAYSEMAVYSFFGESVEVKPCESFAEVFESVKTDTVNYGVVPIENSIEGSVNRTYDLFLEYGFGSPYKTKLIPRSRLRGIIR